MYTLKALIVPYSARETSAGLQEGLESANGRKEGDCRGKSQDIREQVVKQEFRLGSTEQLIEGFTGPFRDTTELSFRSMSHYYRPLWLR